jgi:hypothetical protein
LTAAQWNASVRDNLLETAPGKATTSGRIFVSTGANAIAQRVIANAKDTGSGTTTSSSFGNLSGASVGPTVSSITTGTLALVSVSSQGRNSNSGASARMSFAISGATTQAALLEQGTMMQNTTNYDNRVSVITLATLIAGSNTFTSQYLASSGTSTFSDREIIVIAL